MTTANGGRRAGTALVTGATGGIGLELARELARGGYDLVLVARRERELREVADGLAREHGVRAFTAVADLSDPAGPDRVAAEAERLAGPVDVLVNNAGYAQYGAFVEADAEEEARMVQLNVAALTRLTRLFLPGMVARGRGRVLNVASTAAFMPGPLMAVYYASKAYVLSLSEALAEETRGTGVTVTALCPGPTETGFQARAGMEESKLVRGKKIMDSATVAREGVRGMLAGEPVVIPGAINRLQAMSPRFLPRRLIPRMVRRAQERAEA